MRGVLRIWLVIVGTLAGCVGPVPDQQTPPPSPTALGETPPDVTEMPTTASPEASLSPDPDPTASPTPWMTPLPSPSPSPTPAAPSPSPSPTQEETEAPTPEDTPEEDTPPPRADAAYYDEDHIVQVSISMDEEDFEELSNQERSFYELVAGEDCLGEPPEEPYTWFHANVVIDGTLLKDVGIRKKGFFGSNSTTKPGLKLEFDQYIDDQGLAGMERMTLNNSTQDPSLIRQCLSYFAFKAAGAPTPRCNFAQVWVNGDYLGVYVNLEPLGKDFLRQHFPDEDGDLYEGAISDFRDDWTGSFDPKTNDTDPDLGPVLDLTEALKVPEQDLLASIESLVDVDAFLTHWAMEVMVAHWDSYTGGTNNFYVYRDPVLERMYFLPWGTDDSFTLGTTEGEPTSVYVNAALPWYLYSQDQTKDAYVERMLDLLESAWNERQLLDEIDRMETLILPLATDPETVQESIDGVRNFVIGRRDQLLPELLAGGAEIDDPLSALWCIPPTGRVSGTFSGSWFSDLDEIDPLNSGAGTLAMDWYGESLEVDPGGAIAGIDEVSGKTVILISTPDSRWTYYQVSLVLPKSYLQPGVYEIDSNGTVDAELNLIDVRLPPPRWPLAAIFNGELVLESIQPEAGGTVSGSFTGELFAIHE